MLGKVQMRVRSCPTYVSLGGNGWEGWGADWRESKILLGLVNNMNLRHKSWIQKLLVSIFLYMNLNLTQSPKSASFKSFWVNQNPGFIWSRKREVPPAFSTWWSSVDAQSPSWHSLPRLLQAPSSKPRRKPQEPFTALKYMNFLFTLDIPTLILSKVLPPSATMYRQSMGLHSQGAQQPSFFHSGHPSLV